MSWEREVSAGMEKQKLFTEALYDESFEAGQNDLCCEVRKGDLYWV